MTRSWMISALLAGACMLTATSSRAQKPTVDLGLTYNAERGQVAPGGSGFWLQGGGADAAVTFFKGVGIAVSLSGVHASNVQPGVDVNKIVYLAGPRYTHSVFRSGHAGGLRLFEQVLLGGAHGFDGLFPVGSGVASSANSFALQAGAGLDLTLRHGLGLRLLEVDYVRTSLPNNSSNTQNDLRLAFGLSDRF